MKKLGGINTPFKEHCTPMPGPKTSDQGVFKAPYCPSGSRTEQGIGEVQIDTKVGKGRG